MAVHVNQIGTAPVPSEEKVDLFSLHIFLQSFSFQALVLFIKICIYKILLIFTLMILMFW